MKLKEIITYIATVLINISLGFLLTTLFFKDSKDNFILITCGVILFSILIDSVVAKKLNFKLDIYAYNIEDIKYLILNSIFIGDLFSIPLAMFLSLPL